MYYWDGEEGDIGPEDKREFHDVVGTTNQPDYIDPVIWQPR